jgi:hypothetical protein
MKKFGVTLLLVPALLGCEAKPQNPLVEPENFAGVYVALLKATQQDSLPPAARDSLLQSFGYEQHQLQEAARYYREHAELWQEVLNRAVERLEQEVKPPATDSLQTAISKDPK